MDLVIGTLDFPIYFVFTWQKQEENDILFILLFPKSILTSHYEDNYTSCSNLGLLFYLLSFQTLIPMMFETRDDRKQAQPHKVFARSIPLAQLFNLAFVHVIDFWLS